MNFLILPHQLFDPKYLPKGISAIYLYEHPQYFTQYKYNKKRLVMHRSSMQYYLDLLKKKKYSVKYIEFGEKLPQLEWTLFDPIDRIKIPKATYIESPNFLLTKEQYIEYREKKSTKFFFNAFYTWGKEQINIIPKIKSQDRENRKTMPNNLKVPDILSNNNSTDNKYITEAIKYVEKYFKNNYGDTEDYQFPISHQTAKKWLMDFIENKLNKFGDYQDYIMENQPYLYHSLLSTSINIGLINPTEIIDLIRPLKDKININSYEGYIRQLFWREYQRFCYIHFDFSKLNYFGNNKKLTASWYNGTTGIPPVDDTIKMAFKYGYLHHILRLMVIGNWMNLTGIDPREGFKWFMEFSCDSYEWVMEQNVLDMVFCVSGGQTMRKPYISSSNYIIKMSSYKKGEWSDKWDLMYQTFLKEKKDKLLPRFAYAFAIRYK
jgi:deoxyribodipyrimidine photolyase-related protein